MKESTLKTLDIMRDNGFIVHTFESAGLMRDFVLSSIPENASVGFGGSVTVRSMGIYEALDLKGGHKLYDHWRSRTLEERLALQKGAHSADVYLMSSNAVSADGGLYNVDGVGNRISALLSGPDKVFVLLGENKFTESKEAAIERVRTIAAPKNAVRLDLNLPCARLGRCTDCKNPNKMCKIFNWFYAPAQWRSIYICVCPEKLGY